MCYLLQTKHSKLYMVPLDTQSHYDPLRVCLMSQSWDNVANNNYALSYSQ